MIECKTHGQQIDVVCKKCYETLQRELEEVKIDRQAWKDNCDDMGEAIRDLRKGVYKQDDGIWKLKIFFPSEPDWPEVGQYISLIGDDGYLA